jgi:hypothetical protein
MSLCHIIWLDISFVCFSFSHLRSVSFVVPSDKISGTPAKKYGKTLVCSKKIC